MAVCYFPALAGGFVWDDVIFAEEPVIHSPSGLRSIWLAPADIKNEGHYWPLVYTGFWLEHKLWGLAPVGYHAVNIVLHLLNSLLLWRLLVRAAPRSRPVRQLSQWAQERKPSQPWRRSNYA